MRDPRFAELDRLIPIQEERERLADAVMRKHRAIARERGITGLRYFRACFICGSNGEGCGHREPELADWWKGMRAGGILFIEDGNDC